MKIEKLYSNEGLESFVDATEFYKKTLMNKSYRHWFRMTVARLGLTLGVDYISLIRETSIGGARIVNFVHCDLASTICGYELPGLKDDPSSCIHRCSLSGLHYNELAEFQCENDGQPSDFLERNCESSNSDFDLLLREDEHYTKYEFYKPIVWVAHLHPGIDFDSDVLDSVADELTIPPEYLMTKYMGSVKVWHMSVWLKAYGVFR